MELERPSRPTNFTDFVGVDEEAAGDTAHVFLDTSKCNWLGQMDSIFLSNLVYPAPDYPIEVNFPSENETDGEHEI